jgi:hypothetical protein
MSRVQDAVRPSRPDRSSLVNTDERIVDAVERIILGGVAITARALVGEVEDLTFPQWRVLTIVGEQQRDAVDRRWCGYG